ncbi:hypothetical protein YSA_10874 [Pseudomonas putida ND6]|uniref:Uncharacterized protein n=1 Tax=Pseudomonas putida ND6 TaxID=231023 RepID=I3V4J6_PSEPU|nr:hypothetical protein YSA_10874 [Pseudomonas putida ND6]
MAYQTYCNEGQATCGIHKVTGSFRPKLCANARERHNFLIVEIVAATIMTRFIPG